MYLSIVACFLLFIGSCTKKDKRSVGECAKGLSDEELAESTGLTEEMVKLTRVHADLGTIVHGLAEKAALGISKGLREAKSEVEISARWKKENGSYQFTTAGDRQFALTVRFYDASGTLITHDLFTLANYLVNPAITATGDSIAVAFTGLGPLAHLVGISATTPNPLVLTESGFLKLIDDNLAPLQIEVELTASSESDGKKASISARSEKRKLSDLASDPFLEFKMTGGEGSWAEKDQNLTIEKWDIKPALGLFGLNGVASFKVTGASPLKVYKGEIIYGDSTLIPATSPKVTILCEDDTLAKPAADSFLASLFGPFSKAAQESLDKISEQSSTQTLKCDNPSTLRTCIVDAAKQISIPETPSLDIALVLDVSGSMYNEVDLIKAKAIEIATDLSSTKKSIDSRIGLVTFSDDVDPYIARIESPLMTDPAIFKANIANVQLLGGGDFPEAHLDGLKIAMQDLAWRASADLRLIILVTDASYKNPAPQGTTLEQIIDLARSKSILIAPILMGF